MASLVSPRWPARHVDVDPSRGRDLQGSCSSPRIIISKIVKLIVLDPHGSRIAQVEVTDEHSHRELALSRKCHIHFGCKLGSCGACLIKTSEPTAFQDPIERESKTLERMNAKPNERLTCISCLKTEFSGSDVKIWNAFSVYNPL